MNLLKKAFLKSYDLHSAQTRKVSGASYLVHVLDVAKYLMYETRDEEIISAGLLHDVLEDTSYDESELRDEFGEKVFRLVKFCTEEGNNYTNSDEEQKMTWKKRKTSSIKKLRGASEDELLVFCADKVANLLSMKEDLCHGFDVWSKFNGSKKEIMWYYTEIEKALKEKLEGKRIYSVYLELMKLFEE